MGKFIAGYFLRGCAFTFSTTLDKSSELHFIIMMTLMINDENDDWMIIMIQIMMTMMMKIMRMMMLFVRKEKVNPLLEH